MDSREFDSPKSDDLSEIAEEVEAALSNSSRRLTFTPGLERLFERETGAVRRRHLVRVTLLALAVYLTFLGSDYRLTPDLFGTALFVRLGIVTPVFIVVILLIRRGVSGGVRESLEAAAITLAGVSVVFMLNLGDEPAIAQYDSGLILVLAFGTIVVRLRFRYAVASTVVVVAAYLGMTLVMLGDLPDVVLHNGTILGSGAIFLLLANYSLERESRRAYLYGLRDRMHALALRQSNDQLMALSHLDPLTGIANRRHLDEHIFRLCRRADVEPFGIIMIDVDYFKIFNDFYGHTVGDDSLRRVASLLQATLRFPTDRVARFGGEEFVALLPRTELSETIKVAERMLEGIRDLAIPHERSSVAPYVTISAGVLAVDRRSEPLAVLSTVDAALYRAKAGGRDRLAVANAEDVSSGMHDGRGRHDHKA